MTEIVNQIPKQSVTEHGQYVIYCIAWYSPKHGYFRTRNFASFDLEETKLEFEKQIEEQKAMECWVSRIILCAEYYKEPATVPADEVDCFTRVNYSVLFSNSVRNAASKTRAGGIAKGGLIGR